MRVLAYCLVRDKHSMEVNFGVSNQGTRCRLKEALSAV